MAQTPITVGVDLGGTKILAVAVVDGEVVATAKRSTPREGGPDAVLDRVVDAIERLDVGGALGGRLACVGIGAPGPAPPDGTTIGAAPNLAGWDEPVDVGAALRTRLGDDVVVRVDNDVNVAALAESRLGAGAGRTHLLAVFVGTGVGGGVVLDGVLRKGVHGMAGEIGHLPVVPGGEPCGCGGLGHVESYAGRAGIERIARRRHAGGEPTALVDLAGDGRMKSSVIAAAVDQGDAMATNLVAEAARVVGIAVASVSLVVDVDLVAIGGGLAERLGEPFLAEIARSCAAALPWPTAPQVVPTCLGDDAGAIGAALLVDQ